MQAQLCVPDRRVHQENQFARVHVAQSAMALERRRQAPTQPLIERLQPPGALKQMAELGFTRRLQCGLKATIGRGCALRFG